VWARIIENNSKSILKYDLVGIQEVRSSGGGDTEAVSDIQLSVEMGITNIIHVQTFSYKRETCCQFILDGLLVKCRMQFLTQGLFMCFFYDCTLPELKVKVIIRKGRFCEELLCAFGQFLEVAHESIVG